MDIIHRYNPSISSIDILHGYDPWEPMGGTMGSWGGYHGWDPWASGDPWASWDPGASWHPREPRGKGSWGGFPPPVQVGNPPPLFKRTETDLNEPTLFKRVTPPPLFKCLGAWWYPIEAMKLATTFRALHVRQGPKADLQGLTVKTKLQEPMSIPWPLQNSR